MGAGLIQCTIGDTDVTAYLKGLTVQPGNAGVVGKAKLTLNQSAGGLDLRTRMDVKVWVPYDTSDGSGVAARGRLFGGKVAQRQTGNIGNRKTWALDCEDWNCLLDLVERDAAAAKSVNLSAGTFAAQIAQLVQIIQRNGSASVNKEIDATSGVADLYATMPAVTLEPGHGLGWYIQQLCNTVKLADSTIVPRFYLGFDSTFGALDVFGGPVLWVYDGALSPTPAFVFSDTPTGTEKSVYGTFKRTTDASGAKVIQRRQGLYGALVVTSQNDTSQALYPNEYINHLQDPGGNSGYYMAPPIKIDNATSLAEAQAAVDASVASTANPSDTLEWETEERVQPYDPIELKWDLEGIPAGTIYRPSSLSVEVQGVTLVTKLQLNSRRRGILDDGSDEYPQTPVEGDRIPPIPPGEPVVDSEVYDPNTGANWVTAHAAPSPSPDVRPIGGYQAQIEHDGLGTDITAPFDDPSAFNYLAFPDNLTTVRVRAIDTHNNIGDWGDPLVYTSASVPPPDPPTSLAVDTTWTWGILGYLYDGFGGASVRLSFTPPAIQPVYYILEIILGSDSITEKRFPGAHTGVVAEGLIVGNVYTYKVYSEDERGHRSADAATLSDVRVPAAPFDHLMNGGFDYPGGNGGDIRNWTKTETSGGTATLDSASHSGPKALLLSTTATTGSDAKVVSDKVIAAAESYVPKFWAMSPDSAPLVWHMTWYDQAGAALLTFNAGSQALTTNWALYNTTMPAPSGAAYFEITFENNTLDTDIYVDDVSTDPQIIAADMSAGAIAGLTFASLVKWSNA